MRRLGVDVLRGRNVVGGATYVRVCVCVCVCVADLVVREWVVGAEGVEELEDLVELGRGGRLVPVGMQGKGRLLR
jgi:hypothetical protein